MQLHLDLPPQAASQDLRTLWSYLYQLTERLNATVFADRLSAETPETEPLPPAEAGEVPLVHASPEPQYGVGTAALYGHVKLSASTSDTAGAGDGIAATPSAVKSACDVANNAMLALDGLRESLDERLDQTDDNVSALTNLVAEMVPTNHASSGTAYGRGDGTNYGHVKLSASTSGTAGAGDGIAATPSAVKSAYDLANNAMLGLDGLRESLDERLDQTDDNVDMLTNLVAEMVPTNHASSGTAYGKGDGSNYGHVKLSASTSSTSGVSGGIAATPSAVKSAYDLAKTAVDVRLNGYRIVVGSFSMPFATTVQSKAVTFGITFAAKPTVITNQVFDSNNMVILDDTITTTGFTAKVAALGSNGTRTVHYIAVGKA